MISLERQPVFAGLGLEQHCRQPWLFLELIMAPKKQKTDKVGTSAAATVAAAAEAAAQDDAAVATEPPMPQS